MVVARDRRWPDAGRPSPYLTSGLSLPAATTAGSRSLLPSARAALHAGHRLEHQGSDESVDQYYRAAVYSYAAITVTAAVVGTEHPDAAGAREIYNEGFATACAPPRNMAGSMRDRT